MHNAHLKVAEAVRERLDLAEVIFVPAGQPWLKVDHRITAVEHRLEMVHLAIAGKSYFKLSTIEVERVGPSYTVDTITELRRLNAGDEIFFILGWDSLAELPHWREPSRLIAMACLVAVHRPGCSAPDLKALESSMPGISGRVVIMDKPEIDISSSDIRQRAAGGRSIRRLVPGPVERYIREHRLYQAE